MQKVKRLSIPYYVDPVTGKECKKDVPGAEQRHRKTSHFYVRGIPGEPRDKYFKLATDKHLSERMAHDLYARGEKKAAGYIDPAIEAAKKPLTEHLEEFTASITATGIRQQQARYRQNRLTRLLKNCGFNFPPDINADRVRLFLTLDLDVLCTIPALEPGLELYRLQQIANILGIEKKSVTSLAARHRINAVGYGKSRRYPAAEVQRLIALANTKMSSRGRNEYLKDLKMFCKWMCQRGRLPANPVSEEHYLPEDTVSRHGRRVLDLHECRVLLETACASQRTFRDMNGYDRMMIYATALGTGFRSLELSELCPEHFVLAGPLPHIQLPARMAKNRKSADQPLHKDLASALASYIEGKPARQPLWPGTWHERAADMMRVDLDAAGIIYEKPGRNGPEYADFHCLRHTFGRSLKKSGVQMDEAMQLMRHSDPKLTMKVYGAANAAEKSAAVNALPSLLRAGGHAVPLDELDTLGAVDLRHLAALGLLLTTVLAGWLSPPATVPQIAPPRVGAAG